MNVTKTLKTAAAALCALAALAPLAGAQVKPNDYTKQNKTLEKKEFETRQSGLVEKRSRMQEREFKPREYTPRKDSQGLIEKSFYIDGKSPQISTDKKFSGEQKQLESKEFSPKKKDWLDAEKKQKIFDTERDLSKTYKGKIDTQKRSPFDTEYLQNVYGQMQERSMQDINKYQFRHSHPTDPGIKTVRAGEQLNKDGESSFLDQFSTRKKIEIKSPLIEMRGNPKPQRPAETAAGKSAATPAESPNAPMRAEQGGKVKSIEYLDAGKSGNYDFLRVPKGMKPKGRAIIKVETDD